VDSITNGSGAIEVRLSFASFGSRRNEATWSGNPTSGDWTGITGTTRRGFTFHESLDNLSLIHMNGRVFDPVMGRFLSADPFVPAPSLTQSFNRYSYTRNNPLSFIDPSGFGEDYHNYCVDYCWTPNPYEGHEGIGGGRSDSPPPSDPTPPHAPPTDAGAGNGQLSVVPTFVRGERPQALEVFISANTFDTFTPLRLIGITDASAQDSCSDDETCAEIEREARAPLDRAHRAGVAAGTAGEVTLDEVVRAYVWGRAVKALGAIRRLLGMGRAAESAREFGLLRDVARTKGDFGMGAGTSTDAERLGRAWVGRGYTVASDGKTLVSADKLRQFRPPTLKPNLGKVQANFEWRTEESGRWLGNGHLDIEP
jgi:RHS repeat-associated protein